MGVDLIKIHPSQIVGGPVQRKIPSTPSSSERTRHVPYKYKHQRGMSLMQMYKGSSHERALDAQIRNYRPSARENERVFGAPYRKTTIQPKKQTLEDMIKSGDIELVIEKDGTGYLRKAKKQ
jgi:hypothetical protein